MSEFTPGNYTIKQLAEEDRPREKLLLKGRRVLTNAELLAILLQSGYKNQTAVGLAHEILNTYGKDLNALAKLEVKDLKKFKGVGEAKAISIIAALELGRRRQMAEVKSVNKINSSKDLYNYFYPNISDISHEEFWVIYLNKSNTPLDSMKISSGGVAGTVVDIKGVLKEALLSKTCTSIAVCHNHPSGNLKPSDSDITLTRKLKESAKLMDIVLLDHLIIGDKGFFSFADEGLL